MLMLLQTRGRMTAQELADELEVSVRTVYRDIEALSAAGVPVYGDRGPAGGYQLLEGYRTRLTGLTADEAESLFLAGLPGPAADLGLGSVLAAAQLKLLAALPPQVSARTARIRERFHLDVAGWYRDGDRPEHLAAVADAVWEQHVVWVRYRRAGSGGEVERTLEPLGLVLKGGAWYLVARVGEQIRTYRVARILELTVCEERFERPAGFDLAAFWQARTEHFEASSYRGEATVRLSPRGFTLLGYLATPIVARAARESATPPDAEGWVEVVLPIESIEHAVADLLRLGPDAEVLAPPALRARMIESAEAVVRRYRGV